MKSFTDLFIRRPVLALVVNLVILIAGFQAIRSLNVRQYPCSDNAAVTVTTVYVGASADLVRGFVTMPLERAIAAADGIDYIESNSKLSLSTITARLKLNYDPTKALAEISSKVDQVRNDLPPEAEVPIINVTSVDDPVVSYQRFIARVIREYESLALIFNFVTVDAEQSIIRTIEIGRFSCVNRLSSWRMPSSNTPCVDG